jgi:protein-S-isoprenylcysteine O-methyltransferase Ste14
VVRHPIFLSLMGISVATGLLLTRTAGLAIAISIYIVGTEIRVHAEDAILHKRFGPEFDRYRSRVRAYLPFIR